MPTKTIELSQSVYERCLANPEIIDMSQKGGQRQANLVLAT